MPVSVHRDGRVFELGFVVADGAVKVAHKQYHRAAGEPFYLENKARSYTELTRTGKNGAGGPSWERLQLCEAAVYFAAREAVRLFEIHYGFEWPTDLVGYEVELELEFGDRPVEVGKGGARRRRRQPARDGGGEFPGGGSDCRRRAPKPHTRTNKSATRARRCGLDKHSQAILDGMQRAIYRDDERVTRLAIVKRARTRPGHGDRARIQVRAKIPENITSDITGT